MNDKADPIILKEWDIFTAMHGPADFVLRLTSIDGSVHDVLLPRGQAVQIAADIQKATTQP